MEKKPSKAPKKEESNSFDSEDESQTDVVMTHKFDIPVKEEVKRLKNDPIPEFSVMEIFDPDSFSYELPMVFIEKDGQKYIGQVWELDQSKLFQN